jgi:hypothetical protein
MEAPYTRLYVNCDAALNELREHVAAALNGQIEFRTVVAYAVEADVMENIDSDPSSVLNAPCDFIHYPYSVEIEGTSNVTLAEYINVVSHVMRSLHSTGAWIVASCDWESDLPGSGKLGGPFEIGR